VDVDEGMTDLQRRITATTESREYLTKADPVIGGLIKKYGIISYPLATDYLSALLSNIVGQQLSGKAADAIWNRFTHLLNERLLPEKIFSLEDEKLRKVGLSYNKISYIRNISRAVFSGNLTFDNFNEMSDGEIVKQLTAIKGIGQWTAEMFLIFSLGRIDIFSKGDGGLARAVDNLYNSGKQLPIKERLAIAEQWKPFRSIVSLYLWKSLDNK
jgi:DNA-3-methyladenine glycosylase II